MSSRRSLKKSDRVESNGRDSLLGIKRGGNCQKHKKNMFFEQIAFFKTICLNHKRITDVALFKKEIESDSIMVALLSRERFDESDLVTVALF